jgi:hypothetical protein
MERRAEAGQHEFSTAGQPIRGENKTTTLASFIWHGMAHCGKVLH